MEYIIRNVKFEDLKDVSTIVIKGWQTAYRGIIDDDYLDGLSIEENYQKRVKDYKEKGFIVAEQNGKIVGFCRYRNGNMYKENYPEVDCEICALYVKPEEKGKGIGKALVEYVKNEFRKKNFKKMIIWCFKDNYPSRAFYERVGGKLCGETTCVRGGKEYKEVGFICDLFEKFMHIRPTIKYKEAAIEYINEFYKYNSKINGVGGLDRYIENYEGWLDKIEKDRNRIPDENKVPTETFFLIRKTDNKIIGMINIRLVLNEKLRRFGGNIGYSIRPTERGKGYNKINLYLGLKCCQEHGIQEVLMGCDKDNLASAKTMLAFDAKLIKEYYDEENAGCLVQDYVIDVNNSIEKFREKFEKCIEENEDLNKNKGGK